MGLNLTYKQPEKPEFKILSSLENYKHRDQSKTTFIKPVLFYASECDKDNRYEIVPYPLDIQTKWRTKCVVNWRKTKHERRKPKIHWDLESSIHKCTRVKDTGLRPGNLVKEKRIMPKELRHSTGTKQRKRKSRKSYLHFPTRPKSLVSNERTSTFKRDSNALQ